VSIDPQEITGVILAGGRGSRMGGIDKGLQTYRGVPLVMHALLRLKPQVGHVMINANRNLGAYEALGVPVWPDVLPDHPGPLAGFLTALERCDTDYLVTVPCDSPHFPPDLVARLAQDLDAAGADIAMARTPGPDGARTHPVFCLMKARVMDSLVHFTQSGQRKIDRWTAEQACVEVDFDDASAFFNANTIADLQALEGAGRP